MLTSDFSTCYTSLGDTREHPEFGIENKKKVKVRGYVCDVYTIHKDINQSILKDTLCLHVFSSIPYSHILHPSGHNIQADCTIKI